MKVLWFFRNRDLKRYFEANPLSTPTPATELIKWLNEFYCPRYLKHQKDGTTKSCKITQFIQKNPPAKGTSAIRYLEMSVTKQDGSQQHRALMSLIGLHRRSRNQTKKTWGLEVIEQYFKCESKPADIHVNKLKRRWFPKTKQRAKTRSLR